MALIQCPECAKDISDKVKACPHCGYPLKEMPMSTESIPQLVKLTGVKYNKPKSKKTIRIVIIVLALIIFAVAGYFVIQSVTKHQEVQKAQAVAKQLDQKAQNDYINSFNTYIDNLYVVQAKMLSSSDDAETVCNLVYQVWNDWITLKMDNFIAPNGHTVRNINQAIANVYAAGSTKAMTFSIESTKEDLQPLIGQTAVSTQGA